METLNFKNDQHKVKKQSKFLSRIICMSGLLLIGMLINACDKNKVKEKEKEKEAVTRDETPVEGGSSDVSDSSNVSHSGVPVEGGSSDVFYDGVPIESLSSTSDDTSTQPLDAYFVFNTDDFRYDHSDLVRNDECEHMPFTDQIHLACVEREGVWYSSEGSTMTDSHIFENRWGRCYIGIWQSLLNLGIEWVIFLQAHPDRSGEPVFTRFGQVKLENSHSSKSNFGYIGYTLRSKAEQSIRSDDLNERDAEKLAQSFPLNYKGRLEPFRMEVFFTDPNVGSTEVSRLDEGDIRRWFVRGFLSVDDCPAF